MKFKILGSISLQRRLPRNGKSHEQLFGRELRRELPEIWGKVDIPCLILPSGTVLELRIRMRGFYRLFANPKESVSRSLRVLREIIACRRIVKLEEALAVTDSHSGSFYHWMCDVLQKLEVLDPLDSSLRERLVVVPSSADSKFTRSCLMIYSFNSIVLEPKVIAYLPDAAVFPLVGPSGNHRPELVKAIRARLTESCGALAHSPRRIYISREKANKRRLVNERELRPLLSDHGFAVVVMEDLSFEDQLSLMLDCEVLIGLHGAGLTHMLMMRGRSDGCRDTRSGRFLKKLLF